MTRLSWLSHVLLMVFTMVFTSFQWFSQLSLATPTMDQTEVVANYLTTPEEKNFKKSTVQFLSLFF